AGRAGAAGRGGRGGTPTGPNQCHDITTYQEVGFAGGACAGYGLLLDIREPTHPVRIDFAGDTNMSFWHSATFSNDGTKVLFSDEWGGGRGARCRAEDRLEWGANALFTIEKGKLVHHSYYKMPAAQTEWENCVAHNGSLIPIPGREVMVQGFYQGGITVFDWTDVKNPREIAFFDRGPLEDGRLTSAGSWSVYWHNGYIYSSEIARGLDVYELMPTPHLSQNEIDAARTVRFEEANAQDQRKFVWPPSFALARAFVDQLERSKGLSAADITATRTSLQQAEAANGDARRTALTALATRLNGLASGSSDRAKLTMLVGAVTDLAK
ncbi:MAG: LVIVD repeat-containing protein, partial [Vicinamibacterales bacterium]